MNDYNNRSDKRKSGVIENHGEDRTDTWLCRVQNRCGREDEVVDGSREPQRIIFPRRERSNGRDSRNGEKARTRSEQIGGIWKFQTRLERENKYGEEQNRKKISEDVVGGFEY